jgi:hypothetical protein
MFFFYFFNNHKDCCSGTLYFEFNYSDSHVYGSFREFVICDFCDFFDIFSKLREGNPI